MTENYKFLYSIITPKRVFTVLDTILNLSGIIITVFINICKNNYEFVAFKKNIGLALQIEDKVQMLRKACQNHQKIAQEVMCGKGVDRHLFCLYVISKYLKIESPFLQVGQIVFTT